MIKMVQAMRHGVLPQTLHVDAPSSKVDWEAGEIELLTEQRAWEPNGRPRRAGVSSFGISGTNAHVILEEAPEAEPVKAPEAPEAKALPGAITLPLSAKSETALREAAERLAAHLTESPELDPADVAYSLTTTRALFEQRAVVTGPDREQLLEGLGALARDESAPNLSQGKAKSGKLAYLFTGQGAQRAAMGKELSAASPIFAKALEETCEALDRHLERGLLELLFAEEGSEEAKLLDQTAFTQPALFAIEVALFRTLEALGLSPDCLAGHSIGELAAAHVSGALSLPDAARLVSARGALMGALPEGGAMVAIEATEQEAKEAISGKEAELSIAAINGPSAVVISGQEQAALEVKAAFEEQGRRTKRLAVSHAFHSPLMEPMLADFEAVARELDYHEPKTPIVSSSSGELLSPEQAQDPAYWVSHVREPVRFADAVATLEKLGASAYLELGPDAVLTAMAATCLPEDSGAALIATLRQGRGEPEALLGAIASAHVHGAGPELQRLYPGAKRVPLPTYPFQRERYWIAASAGAQDLGAAGLADADHPLLAATLQDPGGERLTLTGAISLATHPWLADHAVLGTVILPGTAFLELALRAGEEAECETIEELTLQAPLVLSEQGAVSLQVSVGPPEEEGNRQISIHSRAEGEEGAGEWVLHATGSLSPQAPPAPEPLASWPPEGAEPIETEGLYGVLEEIGYGYGPTFQGLGAAWRDGEEIYAEVSLPDEQREQAARFAIHPALLDSTFHAPLALALASAEEGGKPTLPFSWSGVGALSAGASALRVRLSIAENRLKLSATDPTGMPVIEIDSLIGRPVEQGQLAAKGSDALYRMSWQGLSLPEAEEAPDATLLDAREWPEAQGEPVEASHAIAARALAEIQAHLEAEAESRLIFITTGALAAGEGQEPSLPAATLAGLLRSAASEHPGRFGLIDTDDSEASTEALPAAIAALAEEPQLALREGEALVGRLAEAARPEGEGEEPLDPEKTILITGATGGLGALFARHFAERHEARHLLLVSRSGEEAQGAKELREELEALGAQVRIAACDVSDREQLEELIDSIGQEHPLGAVIHSAGVFDNSLIADLQPERLRKVMVPKVDAAHHLHELTEGLDLDAFVLFSSAAGLLGGPGQSNYAAANSFLDALAQKRQAQGLAATSLAWGLWGQETNLVGEIDNAEIERFLRQSRMLLGFAPMPPEQGLGLFDAASSLPDSLLAPVRFDRAALRAQAKAGALPAPMRGLVRVRATSQREKGWLLTRLAALDEGARSQALEAAIRSQVAATLGHSSPDDVEPQSSFPELGFDSLGSLEMRDWLNAATGLNLPVSVLFDYPTPESLAQYIEPQLDTLLSKTETQAPRPASAGSDSQTQKATEVLSIASLYERAESLGRSEEAGALLAIAAKLRPAYTADTAHEHLPEQVQLTNGPSGPKLICIPSLLAVGGPQQYVRFAQGFAGKRNVAVVPIPGFLDGELLPENLQAACLTQAAAIRKCADGQPYVLLGHSTGGLLAHIVAEYLSSIGDPPSGLIKADTYSTAGLVDITPHALAGMRQLSGSYFELTDQRLTAMIAYFELIKEFEPGPIPSASLLLRATEPMPGMSDDGDQRAQWDDAQTVIDVPGNHFTMMEDHASDVSQVVEEWLLENTSRLTSADSQAP